MKTEIFEDEISLSSTKVSEDEKDQYSNPEETKTSLSTERLPVDEEFLMKYETLHLLNKFDFVWPGTIERIKVVNIRKK